MFRNKKLITKFIINSLLLALTLNFFQISVNAEMYYQSQEENNFIKVGDKYRLKFEILRLNGSSDDAYLRLSDIENLLIREGDIIEIEVLNIYVDFFYNYQIIIYGFSINGAKQYYSNETSNLLMYTIKVFSSTNKSYYQDKIDSYNNMYEYGDFDSLNAYISNDRFYSKIHFNQSKNYYDRFYEYFEEEVIISKGIFSYSEIKYSPEFFIYGGDNISTTYVYDHIAIKSLDYPPIYAKPDNSDLFNFLKENLGYLFTDIFFYVILAELGGLILLVTYLRRKKAL